MRAADKTPEQWHWKVLFQKKVFIRPLKDDYNSSKGGEIVLTVLHSRLPSLVTSLSPREKS